MKYIGWRKYLTAFWCFVECLLFSGLIYGWAPLVFVFKQEGIYADLCPPDNKSIPVSNFSDEHLQVTGSTLPYIYITNSSETSSRDEMIPTKRIAQDHRCKAQDDQFALAFTIASTLFCASCAFIGQINYKFGTRVTRIVSMCSFVAGVLMLGFASKEIPWLVFTGLTFMGVGGLPVFVTNAQVSKIFRTGSSTYIGLLSGAYDSSCALMFLVKFAFENGISKKYSFIFLIGLHSIVAISTFGFLPRTFIPDNVEIEVKDVKEDISKMPLNEKNQNDKKEEEILDNENIGFVTLRQCICSPIYLLHLFWMCILQLRFFYYLGSLNTHLNRLTGSNPVQVSHFTDVSMFTMFAGVITSTIAGVVYDWQKRVFKDSVSPIRRQLMPAVLPMIVACLLSIMQSVLTLLHDHVFLYICFVTMTLKRSFLYGVGTAFLTTMYPIKYFGILYGILIISAGLTSFLQIGFFTWSQSYTEAPLHVNITMLCLVFLSIIHPAYQWWSCRKYEKEAEIKKNNEFNLQEKRRFIK